MKTRNIIMGPNGNVLILEYLESVRLFVYKRHEITENGIKVYAVGPRSASPSDAKNYLCRIIPWVLKKEAELKGSVKKYASVVSKPAQPKPNNQPPVMEKPRIMQTSMTVVCPTGYVTEVEGYKVFFRTPYKAAARISGEIIHQDGKVIINVNGPDCDCWKSNVIAFVQQRIDMIIAADEERMKNYKGIGNPKVPITKSGYSHVNPRKDIVDDELIKVIKRKRKTSVISPTFSTPFTGQKERPKNGILVINSEGRLVHFHGGGDDFREQR